MQRIKAYMQKRFDRWLSKRIPSSYKHKLSSRNIFIIPTRFGFAYLLFVVLLFLLGTNYQNNIILLFSYLLASLFITVMLHTFYNFSQLTFSSSAKQFTFANQPAYFDVEVSAKKVHFDLNFYFAKQNIPSNKIKLEQCVIGSNHILLPSNSKQMLIQRGIHDLGRVKVFSEYPLGFFITWAMLDFSHQLVVFPQPKKLNNHHNYLTGLEESTSINALQSFSSGIDDFHELKAYMPGESQARVAWKQLARGQGKLSKHYQNQQGGLLWLKLSDMPSNDIEMKLSHLCFLILEYGKSELSFGLILDLGINANNTTKIKPSFGSQHQQNCLIALAEYKHIKKASSQNIILDNVIDDVMDNDNEK